MDRRMDGQTDRPSDRHNCYISIACHWCQYVCLLPDKWQSMVAISWLCSRMETGEPSHTAGTVRRRPTCGVKMSLSLSHTHAPPPNSSDSNPVDYTIRGALQVQVCMKCWSGTHNHRASLVTASGNGDSICSVSWIRMADTLNTHFTNYLYCNTVINKGVAGFLWLGVQVSGGLWTSPTVGPRGRAPVAVLGQSEQNLSFRFMKRRKAVFHINSVSQKILPPWGFWNFSQTAENF